MSRAAQFPHGDSHLRSEWLQQPDSQLSPRCLSNPPHCNQSPAVAGLWALLCHGLPWP